MKFGETIPAGFVVECKSWENDGDNDQTIQQTGKSQAFVDVVLAVAPLFGSCHGNSEYGFGNTSSDEVDNYNLVKATQEVLIDLEPHLVLSVLGVDLMNLEMEEFDPDEGEDVFNRKVDEMAHKIGEFVHQNILGYSEWYQFRVASKVTVYHLAEPVVIPDVEQVASISV